nr:hypothetical protein [Schwartzia sp. (in: firmicutes)]
TMPSRVSGGKDVSIAFRVGAPDRNRSLVVKANGRPIVKQKRIRLHPAVMEHITVKASDLKDCDHLEVSVE